MDLLKLILLASSVGVVVCFFFIAYLGLLRSALSFKGAVALVSIGGAIGGGLFVYGIGGDLPGAVFVGLSSAIGCGIGALVLPRR